MAKVSIIVPIYNVENYLKRCIESLINQSLKDIEIILVDDESPDSCNIICDQYAKLDNRIKVIHKRNEGLGYARNSGLEIAKGDYIGFVDSDDYVSLSMFEELYNEASKSNADVIFCNNYNTFSDGKIKASYIPYKEKETYIRPYIVNDFLKDMIASSPEETTERKYYMSVWRCLFKRDIIKNIKFESEREYLSEDLLFQIKILPLCKKVILIPNCLYYYWINPNSLTKSYRKDRIQKTFSLYERISNDINKLQITNKEEWNIRLLKLLFGYVRFSFKANINGKNKYKNKDDLKKDFLLVRKYFYKIDFYKKYPINKIPFKYRILLFTLKHDLFQIFIHLMSK